jgi:hypothetical protein
MWQCTAHYQYFDSAIAQETNARISAVNALNTRHCVDFLTVNATQDKLFSEIVNRMSTVGQDDHMCKIGLIGRYLRSKRSNSNTNR